MVPKFSQHEGQVDGVLSKVTFKRDGDEAFLYIVDVSFTILNSAEADDLDLLFPGAKQTYINCSEKNDDQKEKREVTPVFPSAISIEIASASSGRSLVRGTCKLSKLILSSSKKVTTLTAKCEWGGQSEGAAANLAHGLGGPVNFIWEFAQQSLFRSGGSGNAAKLTPKAGDIVHGTDDDGDPVYGRVVEVSEEDETCLVDDFGFESQVSFGNIESKWTVNADDPDFDKCIKSYIERCDRRNLLASWKWLTIATGEAFADGAPGDGAHVLTKKIIAQAVALQEEEETGAATETEEDGEDPAASAESSDDGASGEEEAPAEPGESEPQAVETEPVAEVAPVQAEPEAAAPDVAANAPAAVEENVIPMAGRRRRKVAGVA